MSNDEEFLKKIRAEYLQEAIFLVEQCEESSLKLEDPTHRANELAKIFRLAHSLKGSGIMVGFSDLADFTHVLEDFLTALREHPEELTSERITLLLRSGDEIRKRVLAIRDNSPEPWDIEGLKKVLRQNAEFVNQQTKVVQPVPAAGADAAGFLKAMAEPVDLVPTNIVKISTERIESVVNFVGELVVLNSQLMTKAAQYPADVELSSLASLFDKTIRELQDKTLSMRMTPLKMLFLKAQRSIRDLSLQLGKAVEFRMSGEETEIDRTMVDMLADPLLHLVRNSIDHGIESGERRKEAQKNEKGTIHISSWQAGGRVFIALEDDGGGINHQKVLKRAKEMGLIGENSNDLSESEINHMLFAPGFSTAEQVTDISGRGVGLDVVRTNIEKLHGTIDVRSTLGKGTCFTIALPLTTAIMNGMLVACDGAFFVIPMEQIQGLAEYDEKQDLTYLNDGRCLLRHRDKMIPLFSLRHFVGSIKNQSELRRQRTALILRSNSIEFALEVSEAFGQIQVVLKSLSDQLSHVSGITGGAILGDGRVVLILDVEGLHRFYSRPLQSVPSGQLRRAER